MSIDLSVQLSLVEFGITARVVGYADATTTDELTLYVKYLTTATQSVMQLVQRSTSVANSTIEFVNGESLAAR